MKPIAIMVALAAVLSGGCGLLDDPTPDEARLVIQGDADKPVRVIISTEFVSQVNEQGQTRVVIFAADTLITTLPYDQVYAITEEQRFFVEAARLDADLDALTMQVFIDRRKLFDEGGRLLESAPYRFVYTFNQPVTRDIVVL
ncbi:MAG TPA: hypothetical protein VFZ69_10165 [Longimicrobiales bacterium]